MTIRKPKRRQTIRTKRAINNWQKTVKKHNTSKHIGITKKQLVGGLGLPKWIKRIIRRDGANLKQPHELQPNTENNTSPNSEILPPTNSENNSSNQPPPRPIAPKPNLPNSPRTNLSPIANPSNNSTITKISGINTSKLNYNNQQVKKFMILFEKIIHEHDSIEYTEAGAKNNKTYTVSPGMLGPYLRKNGLAGDTKSIWTELFIKHRYLLYLDQFCGFIDFMRNPTHKPEQHINLETFIESNYFELPIAKKLNLPGTNQLPIEPGLKQTYAKQVYDKFNDTISSGKQPKMDNINDFRFLYAHGGLGHISLVNMLIVPDNVVIAFLTPFNKIESTVRLEITHKLSLLSKLISSFTNSDGTNEFYKTPACFFRDVPFMSNAVYYYPGQLVANCLFSYDLKVETEEQYMGLYQRVENQEEFTNMRDEVFALDNTDNHYRTSLHDIFTTPEKLELITGKVLFISCCRGSDSYIDDITTEFLYRYESIITFYNMSVCNSPLPAISPKMKSAVSNTKIFIGFKDKTYGKNEAKYVFKPSARNSHDYMLFYDSVLSYKFAPGYTRNANKQRKTIAAGNKFLEEFNKQPNAKKLEYIRNELPTCTQEKTTIPDILYKLTEVFKITLPKNNTWDDILTKEFDNINYISRYFNRIINSDNHDEYFTQFINLLLTRLKSNTILQHLINVSYNIKKDDKSVNVCQQVLQNLFSNHEILNKLQLGYIYSIYLNLVKGKTIINENEKEDIIRTTNNLACLLSAISKEQILPPTKDLGFQTLFICNILNILSMNYNVYSFDFLKLQTINNQYLFNLDMILPTDAVNKIVDGAKYISDNIKALFKQPRFQKLFNISILVNNDLSNAIKELLVKQNKFYTPETFNDLIYMFLYKTDSNPNLVIVYNYIIDFINQINSGSLLNINISDFVLPTDAVNKIVDGAKYISDNIKALFKQPRFQKLFYVSILVNNDLSNAIKELLVKQNKFYTPETFNDLIYMFLYKTDSNPNLVIVYNYIIDFINQINSGSLLNINISDFVLPSDLVVNIVNGISYISDNIKALFKQPRFQKLFYVSILVNNDLSNAIKELLVKQQKFYTPEILFVLVYIWETKNSSKYNSNLKITNVYITDFINQINSGSLLNINISDFVLPSDLVINIVNGISYISDNIKALFKQPRFQKLFYVSILVNNDLSNAITELLVKQNKFYTPEILFVLVYIWETKNSSKYNSNLKITNVYITDFINQINSGSLLNINISDFVLPSDLVINIVNGISYISDNIKALFKQPRFQKLFYVSILVNNDLSNAITELLVKQNKFYTPEILFVLVYIFFTKHDNGGYNPNLNILCEYISEFIRESNNRKLSENFPNDPYYILLHCWCLYIYNKWYNKPTNQFPQFLDVANYKITSNNEVLGNYYVELWQKIVGIDKSEKTPDYNSLINNNQLGDVRGLIAART